MVFKGVHSVSASNNTAPGARASLTLFIRGAESEEIFFFNENFANIIFNEISLSGSREEHGTELLLTFPSSSSSLPRSSYHLNAICVFFFFLFVASRKYAELANHCVRDNEKFR